MITPQKTFNKLSPSGKTEVIRIERELEKVQKKKVLLKLNYILEMMRLKND